MSLIRNINPSDRPREKLIREGVESLSNEELLALLIGSGTKNNSALDISKELLERYGGLNNLLNCDIYSLMKIKGIKKAKANLLIAILEISKRASKEKINFIQTFTSAKDIYDLTRNDLEFESQEKFIVIYLNVKLQIIKKETLFKGGETKAFIDINMIFKHAILCGAKNIICVHNHPSGDSTPSEEDIKITNDIRSLSKIVKIPLLDHIIIGKKEYFSFSQMNC